MMTNNNPSLPSAKPHRPTAAILLCLSGVMLIAGVGLGASAVAIYHGKAQQRIDQDSQLAELDRDAELRQREAQLQRGYDAPVWSANQTYDPARLYEVDGVREIEVPVLLGPQLDTAVCIGTMGPDGFIQNLDHELCLGY